MMNRARKVALLQSLLTGTATTEQIEALRKSREPIYLTMIIDENMANVTSDPQYCMEVSLDGQAPSRGKYLRYDDGREVEGWPEG